MSRSTFTIIAVLAASLFGCSGQDGGSTPPPAVDGGTDETPDETQDGGTIRGMVSTCGNPVIAEGVRGTVTVEVDTTGGERGSLNMGGCGAHTDAPELPPQLIVEYLVPGEGQMVVDFTTDTPATPNDFDTVIQVRMGSCSAVPTMDYCFDDIDTSAGRFQTAGTVEAAGGSTLYFIVTGFAFGPGRNVMNLRTEGPVGLAITATPR